MIEIALSEQDKARVSEEMARLSRGAGFRITLPALVKGWSDLVSEVERGYQDCLDEYQNDVSARELLQRVIPALSEEGRAELGRILGPIDARFLAATLPVKPPLRVGTVHMWWTRVPGARSAELDEELRSLGYVLEELQPGR